MQLASIILIAGCTDEKKVIDDIDAVTAVGYDYIDGKRIEETVSMPIFKPDKSISSHTLSDSAQLIREVRAKLDAESNKPLLSGKLEVAFYNKELAKHGIFEYIDDLNRDPSIGSRVFLGIVDGKAKDFLKKKFETQDTGVYYSNMFEKNIQNGTIPETNLHRFMYMYYSKGEDPFLPLFTLKRGTIAKLDGIALFNKDKYVGKIPFEQTFAFKTMVENFKEGIFPIYHGKHSAVVENVRAKRNFKIDFSEPVPKVRIEIVVDGVIREYKGAKINQQVIRELKKKMENQINSDCNTILATLQELNADPIGIGDLLKSRSRNFDINKYRDYYPVMNIKANAKVSIVEYGVNM